ncbi:MAG: methylated-DNA--[protein]-cysteine S-methyltransferase [Thermodesulfobacteriota bacterium]
MQTFHRKTIYYDSREYPRWGRFYGAASEKGLCLLALPGERAESFFEKIITRFSPDLFIQHSGYFEALFYRLESYLQGREVRFQGKLDLAGTPFQLKVWEALQAIPYGETRGYGEIARAIGSPRAARAVGQANHNNPVPIVIPCHRVIGSQGGLVGFGGGLALKEKLLNLERKS